MVKLNKEEIVGGSMLILGVGMFFGVMLSDHNYVSLRVTMINEVQANISDMEWDVKQGKIDSSEAAYYLHNWEVIENQLIYTPDEYTEWYEQNSKYNTKYNSNWLDSVCFCCNTRSNYKLNTITNG